MYLVFEAEILIMRAVLVLTCVMALLSILATVIGLRCTKLCDSAGQKDRLVWLSGALVVCGSEICRPTHTHNTGLAGKQWTFLLSGLSWPNKSNEMKQNMHIHLDYLHQVVYSACGCSNSHLLAVTLNSNHTMMGTQFNTMHAYILLFISLFSVDHFYAVSLSCHKACDLFGLFVLSVYQCVTVSHRSACNRRSAVVWRPSPDTEKRCVNYHWLLRYCYNCFFTVSLRGITDWSLFLCLLQVAYGIPGITYELGNSYWLAAGGVACTLTSAVTLLTTGRLSSRSEVIRRRRINTNGQHVEQITIDRSYT